MRKLLLLIFLLSVYSSKAQSTFPTLKNFYGRSNIAGFAVSQDQYWISYEGKMVNVNRNNLKSSFYDFLNTGFNLDISFDMACNNHGQMLSIQYNSSADNQLVWYNGIEWRDTATQRIGIPVKVKKDFNDTLWVLTSVANTSRLYKYDGFRFTKPFADIPSSTVDFDFDLNSNPYVAAKNQLLTFNGTSWVAPANFTASATNSNINYLRSTNDGMLYIIYATSSSSSVQREVSYYNGINTIQDALPSGYRTTTINDVSICNGDSILISTENGLIKYYKGLEIEYNTTNANIASNYIKGAFSISNDTILYAYSNGGYTDSNFGYIVSSNYSLAELVSWDIQKKAISEISCPLACSNDGQNFLANKDSIFQYQGNKWNAISGFPGFSVSNAQFKKISVDANNNLWAMGTKGAELFKYDGTTWQTFSPVTSSLSTSDFIFGITNDIWFSVLSQGLWHFDGTNWALQTIPGYTGSYGSLAIDGFGQVY